MTWTKASDNYAVDHYRILRDGVEVATRTGLSFADAGRSPMTTYAYQIIAVDGSGNEGPAAAASAKTPPSAPTSRRRRAVRRSRRRSARPRPSCTGPPPTTTSGWPATRSTGSA